MDDPSVESRSPGRGLLGELLEFLEPPPLGARGIALIAAGLAALGLLTAFAVPLPGLPFTSALPDARLQAEFREGATVLSTFGVLLQILLIDLLLSGDNALVIALACRRLPPGQARAAAFLGATGAIVLRLALTLVASLLISLPLLQALCALPLLVIALNLMALHHETPHLLRDPGASMIAAIGLIMISDAAMSLDNVMALAAVSHGSFWLLAIGLLLTIPLIVWGSLGLVRLMRRAPILVDLGGAVLGFVAGQMIANDPLFAHLTTRAPALNAAIPLACSVFVWVQGRWARAKS